MPIVIDGSQTLSANNAIALDGSAKLPAVDGSQLTNLAATSSVNGKTGAVQSVLVAATAVATTSGTAIDFTNIPSWAKRITVMFNGVSTNGTSMMQIQIGSGSITTTGYSSAQWANNTSSSTNATGLGLIANQVAAGIYYGVVTLTNVSGNIWVMSSTLGAPTGGNNINCAGGGISLSGVLDRLRLTTVAGTDTFDAGSVNIMWE
jgi:hypothetical protein